MNTVIKVGSAREAEVVTPYAPTIPHRTIEAPPPDQRQEELDKLHALLAERDAALEELKSQIAKARIEGEESGRIAAELAAEDSRAKALELLGKGIEEAREALADGRERMEALALLIARNALDKLFGDDRERKAAIGDLVMRQLSTIERQMLLQIEVSRLDFPDTGELAALAHELGLAAQYISADSDLPAGACRMQLRVGTLDVGVDQQWGAIRGLLDELVATAEAA
jgi:type III secretion protein L